MPERTGYAEGVPNWVDLMTPDRDASKAFYGSLFGWDYTDEPTDQGPTYTMCSKNGHQVAGMGPIPPDMATAGMPPMWNSYVAVVDLDATVAKVDGAGGTVVMPTMDVMDAGRMAGIADPIGAAMFLWQAKDHIGATLVNEHGTLTWNELITPDVDTAAAFYKDVLGWSSETVRMPEMTYTIFKVGDDQVGGAMPPPMDGIPPNWGIYFAVDDADATTAAVKAGGGSVMAEPFDAPPGQLATFADPQGVVFSILQPAEQLS